ncbi:MAG TPA: 4'-phosphopantetheinyl transferase superfamily protein [Pirellulales bacterium]
MSSVVESLARPLSREIVRVIRFPLTLSADELPPRRALLSPDELGRADRFVREVDRVKFTAARSALRTILGGLLDRDPAAVAFTYSNRGKPFLADDAGLGLAFNLSHTDGWGMIALSRERLVGVDVERVRPEFEIDATARWVFSPNEQEQFFAAPECDRRAIFFAHWTRKEAFLKGVGLGIGGGLTDTTIAPLSPSTPHGECRVSSTRDDAATAWVVRDAIAPPGYAAAVAAIGADWTLEHVEWA